MKRILIFVAVLTMLTASAAAAKDLVVGTDHRDEYAGTAVGSVFYGLNGHDKAYMHEGPDDLYGGEGHDDLRGQRGADYLVGGQGKDGLFGGAGDDVIEAADGNKDVVICGPGDDKVSMDAEEAYVKGCE